MLLGFALTQHCNLRCPHCIRDDVVTVRSLEPELIMNACDDALALFGDVTASFTGGEPTLHPGWDQIVSALAARDIEYRLVTNGWHMRRMMPSFDRWPPSSVRLSLSGASQETHDADRGRDSYRRVLLAVALLTSRQIPTALSIVIDRRTHHEVRAAADLAESLGCLRLHYILPQPVPGSVARDSDLSPAEWRDVRAEIDDIAREPQRRTAIQLDYGAPALDGEPEQVCDTMAASAGLVVIVFATTSVESPSRWSATCTVNPRSARPCATSTNGLSATGESPPHAAPANSNAATRRTPVIVIRARPTLATVRERHSPTNSACRARVRSAGRERWQARRRSCPQPPDRRAHV